MKFFVDGWDPSYGSPAEDVDAAAPTQPGASSTARIDVGVEVVVAAWAPVPHPPGPDDPGAVVFVDGVRRIEARLWIPDDDGTASLGIAASYGAGATCCCPDHGAHLLTASTARGLFTVDSGATDVTTGVGPFVAHHVAANPDESPAITLSAALQRSLGDLELVAAARARAAVGAHGVPDGTDLLVIDGPMRGREQLPRTLGFIKTHRAIYLAADQNRVVAALGTGERTPVFLMGTTWDRYAWYLRLPCRPGAPWAGVVRVECAATLDASEAVELATRSQRLLPRYASVEYKDPRAPQNLVPIAGLERELRRRLGDQRFVYRALQAAAAS